MKAGDVEQLQGLERIEGRTEVVELFRWHGGIMDFITMHHEEEWQSMIAKWDINP